MLSEPRKRGQQVWELDWDHEGSKAAGIPCSFILQVLTECLRCATHGVSAVDSAPKCDEWGGLVRTVEGGTGMCRVWVPFKMGGQGSPFQWSPRRRPWVKPGGSRQPGGRASQQMGRGWGRVLSCWPNGGDGGLWVKWRASGKDSKRGTDAIWFTHWKGHSDFCVEDGS